MQGNVDTRRHRAALPVFTPTAVAPESLVLRTVGREAEIEHLVRAIRTAATSESRPHQLIVGPRGSGKTHLLVVALHQASGDPQIAERVAVAVLPEDAVEIAGYEDLLVSIVDRISDGEQDSARTLRSRHDLAGLERVVVEQLGQRVLVLVVENLDRVFRDLGDHGQARFRSFCETSARVLVIASTPLLSEALSDHARPWYGSFEVEHLGELDAEQGRELLARVAAAAGDEELAALLGTPTGLARVRAVEQLAGGSPRMWTVLAGCMTVDLLDELVPLVEALFDELAPYYQQRLWDLPGMERKLVYELCRVQAATVKELAHSTGLSERAAATSLGRLHEARWVRRGKRAGTDQRSTWYSLREPLLRHHVEYRETRNDKLPAIVGFLREWFQAEELTARLVRANPASAAEGYVLAALAGVMPAVFRGAWPVSNGDHLVAAGRFWMAGLHHGGLASFSTGAVAEAVGLCVIADPDTARRSLAARLSGRHGELSEVGEAAIAAAAEADTGQRERYGRGLVAAASVDRALDERDRIALGLLAAGFRYGDPAVAEWFEAHEVRAGELPAGERRLRLIFDGQRALHGLAHGPERGLHRAAVALQTCAGQIGMRDPTSQMLAGQSVTFSALRSDVVELSEFAAVAVNLMMEAELESLLVAAILLGCVLRSTAGLHADLEWASAWAAATSGYESLGPVRRFLALSTHTGVPALGELSSEDQLLLTPQLRTLATALGVNYARASTASAGSSSGGPSRGS